MPIMKHGDIEINYIMEGKGEGAPLVLVHGFGTKLQGWNFQIPYFSERMPVIALDNRGTGKSSRPDYPYTMDMFVKDIKNLLDFLGIKEKIHLCGISMGGMIVQHFSLKYPEKLKTLILCATGAWLDTKAMIDGLRSMEEEHLSPEEKIIEMLPFVHSRPFSRKLKADKEFFNSLKDDTIFITPVRDQTRLQDYMNQAAAIDNSDTRETVSDIKTPTLILVGNRDRLVPSHNSEFLCEQIPNSRLEILKGLGHGLTIESPDEVNSLMWNFIKEHD